MTPACRLVPGRGASDYARKRGGRRTVRSVPVRNRGVHGFGPPGCGRHLGEKHRGPAGKIPVEMPAGGRSPRSKSPLRRVREAGGRGEGAQNRIIEGRLGRQLRGRRGGGARR